MKPLRMVLRANSLSCLVFGTVFLFGAKSVALFLGSMPPIVVMGLGLGLVVNGLHLAAASLRASVRRAEILYFSAGDFAWAGVTAFLIARGIYMETSNGIAAAIAVAIAVAVIGVLQLKLLAGQAVA